MYNLIYRLGPIITKSFDLNKAQKEAFREFNPDGKERLFAEYVEKFRGVGDAAGDLTKFMWSTDFLEEIDRKSRINYSSRLYLWPDDKIEISYPEFDELQFP